MRGHHNRSGGTVKAYAAAAAAVLALVAGCSVSADQPDSGYPKAAKSTEPAKKKSSGITDGNYLVGTDIKAGTYTTPGTGSTDELDSCYWERAKDDSQELDSIIANDNITGQSRVTVHNGEMFNINGGCHWKRVS